MKLDSVNLGQTSEIKNNSDITSKLEVGDVFRARILEITSNEFVLKLSNGSQLRASVQGSLEAFKGQMLELMVKSTEGGRIILNTLDLQSQSKPLSTQQSLINAELKTIGMPITEENVKIAIELKQNLYPITKNIIEKAAEALTMFKQLTVDKAAFIAVNDISPQNSNISLIELISKNNLKLGNDISSLIFDIKNFAANQQIASNSMSNNTMKQLEISQASLSTSEQQKNIATTIIDNTEHFKPAELISTNTAFGTKANQELTKLVIQSIQSSRSSELLQSLDSSRSLGSSQSLNSLETAANILEGIFIKLDDIVLSNTNKVGSNDKSLQNSEPTKESSLLQNSTNNSSNQINNSSNEINNKFKGQTFINIAENLKETIDKLDTASFIVAASNHPQAEQILSRIESLQNSIKFIGELNNYNTYMQLPLDIKGLKTTGELYILKRDSRKRKINPEDTSVFISLDTANIGRFESFISLKNRSINLNIGLETSKIIDFMKQNSKVLYDIMQENGYRLADIRYRLVGESTNLLNINKAAAKIMPHKEIGIDLKI